MHPQVYIEEIDGLDLVISALEKFRQAPSVQAWHGRMATASGQISPDSALVRSRAWACEGLDWDGGLTVCCLSLAILMAPKIWQSSSHGKLATNAE